LNDSQQIKSQITSVQVLGANGTGGFRSYEIGNRLHFNDDRIISEILERVNGDIIIKDQNGRTALQIRNCSIVIEYIEQDKNQQQSQGVEYGVCLKCSRAGKFINDQCPNCEGTDKMEADISKTVPILCSRCQGCGVIEVPNDKFNSPESRGELPVPSRFIYKNCPDYEGTGFKHQCPNCEGSGLVYGDNVSRGILEHERLPGYRWKPCPDCKGTGTGIAKVIDQCHPQP